MKESFEEFIKLCEKSLVHDPWVKDRGLIGYCEEIIDETNEVKEAIEKGDDINLKEEIGDVFLDWAHLCLLAAENKDFTVKDVIDNVKEKLARRKPYIVEGRTTTKEEAREIWKKIKEEEKNGKS